MYQMPAFLHRMVLLVYYGVQSVRPMTSSPMLAAMRCTEPAVNIPDPGMGQWMNAGNILDIEEIPCVMPKPSPLTCPKFESCVRMPKVIPR